MEPDTARLIAESKYVIITISDTSVTHNVGLRVKTINLSTSNTDVYTVIKKAEQANLIPGRDYSWIEMGDKSIIPMG